jgi:hypothetical protein
MRLPMLTVLIFALIAYENDNHGTGSSPAHQRGDTSIVYILDTILYTYPYSHMEPIPRDHARFTIPENAIRCAYWVGAGEQSLAEYMAWAEELKKDGFNFFGTTDPVAGVLTGQLSPFRDMSRPYIVSAITSATYLESLYPEKTTTIGKGTSFSGFIMHENLPTKAGYIRIDQDGEDCGIYVKIVAMVVR